MSFARRGTAAVVMAGAPIAGVWAAAEAGADQGDVTINGTFTAFSDGRWATTDYAFHEEAPVTSVWTIESACNAPTVCAGRVSSDQGWSAPLYTHEAGIWYVTRDLPGWQTCPDGGASPGHQTFMFYPSDPDGVTKIGSPHLEGRDKTEGDRNACGRAKPLTIVIPFRLDRIS